MTIEKNIAVTRNLLYLINFLYIMIISLIFFKGNNLICWEGEARKFLEKFSSLPAIPYKVLFMNLTLMFILFLSIYIRNKFLKDKKFIMEFFFFFDMFICVLCIISLNLSYKGIILIAVINVITYTDSSLKRYFYLSLALLTYILLDYDILSVKLNIISINEYVEYFTSTSKLYIYSLRSVFNSLNNVLFIGFMSFSLQKQIKETKEIKMLYSTLMKTTKELSLANIQLENYAKKSEEMAKVKERNRLAREIHDTIGHSLTGIVTGLEACKAIIDCNVDLAKEQIDKITELGRKGLLDIRRSVKALRPDALERFSIDEALRKMVQDITDCTDIKIYMNIQDKNLKKVCPDEEEIVYRIVQESITNAVRHGKSKNIWIDISSDFSHIHNNLIISIKDDGMGNKSLKEGFGLKHIRERINLLNGEFNFGNNKNKGFFINVKIPLRIK